MARKLKSDKVLFFGTAGSPGNVVFGPFPDFIMNGQRQPDAMNLKAGTRYRFRLFNLAGDAPLMVSMNAGDTPVQWRAAMPITLPAASRTLKC